LYGVMFGPTKHKHNTGTMCLTCNDSCTCTHAHVHAHKYICTHTQTHEKEVLPFSTLVRSQSIPTNARAHGSKEREREGGGGGREKMLSPHARYARKGESGIRCIFRCQCTRTCANPHVLHHTHTCTYTWCVS